MRLLILLSLLSVISLIEATTSLAVLLVGSRYKLTEERVSDKRLQILADCGTEEFSCSVFDALNGFTHSNSESSLQGMWTILPAILKLPEASDWTIIAEDTSEIDLKHLKTLIGNQKKNRNADAPEFIGFGLKDREATIVHHFGMNAPDNFLYPLLSSGFILSKQAVELIRKTEKSERWTGFAIDASYEFALFLHKTYNLSMENSPESFCNSESSSKTCLVQRRILPKSKRFALKDDDIHVMIKTFTGHHQNRIPVLQDTWTRGLANVEYCSDTVDDSIPTIDMGVQNTERGHCGKTWAIFRRFIGETGGSSKWLLIADDDTLISWKRLRRMLEFYDPNDRVIIGERYGFGFSLNGETGYDYPTGGSGMIFSRPAVEALLQTCPACAADSDPDDMTIGMCAVHFGIPIVHEARLHQARPRDYAEDSLREPISFHKFTEVDPRMIYQQYLSDEEYTHNEL